MATHTASATVRLWVLVLAAPGAWTVHLLGAWYLSEVLACAPATRPPATVLGLSVNAAALGLNLAALAVALAAGVVSLGEVRRLRRLEDPTPARRATWMAEAGVLGGVLFAIMIAVGTLPVLTLPGCRGFGP